MKKKKLWISYAVSAVIAVLIVLGVISLESSFYGTDTVLQVHFISDGFFVAAVLYLGSSALSFIAEAGNFYGLQYIGHMIICLFSVGRSRLDKRSDYYSYCVEKKAKQKERGKSSAKWVMLFVGLGCLVLSVVFTLVFYDIA